MAPCWPNRKVRSGAPAVLRLRSFHWSWPLTTSTTPTVGVPLPSQSPSTGVEVGLPYANGVRSGAPGELRLRSFQVAGGSPNWAWPSKTPTAVGAITVPLAVAELLAGLGSAAAEVTEAVLVRVVPLTVPGGTPATTVTVAVPPAGTAPRFTVTVPPEAEAVPWLTATDWNTVPAGSASVSTAPWASLGPRLVTVRR